MRKKKKETTLDDVLMATKKGFDAVDMKFAAVDRKLDTIDRKLEHVDKRFDELNNKINMMYQVLDKWPSPSEMDDLFYRMAYIEKSLGIKRRTRKAA